MKIKAKTLSVVCLVGLLATIAGAQSSATGDLHVTIKGSNECNRDRDRPGQRLRADYYAKYRW